MFVIKSIANSIADDVKKGIITIEDAAIELFKANLTPCIDVEKTRELLFPTGNQ